MNIEEGQDISEVGVDSELCFVKEKKRRKEK